MFKPSANLKLAVLAAAGIFFSFAPTWAPHIPKIWGHNLFVTPDAMQLLGITLLVSLLAAYLLPDFIVGFFEKFFVPKKQSEKSQRKIFGLRPIACSLWFISGLLLLVLLVLILYWVNRNILHSFLSSADEHSCYFLAECLRKGKLYIEIPPLADFFKVVHVGMRDGKWYSVYPPGWPLIWAVGLQFNVVDWLNPAMSSLAIFFFFLSGRRLFGRGSRLGQESRTPAEAAPKRGALVSVFGLLVCVLSPFFMFTAASYFSHATCLLCISIFLYTFLRWREDYVAGKDPVLWASLCAFAFGYGLMTRYLTMIAVGGPFLLYHYLPIFLDWKGPGSPPHSCRTQKAGCLFPLWLRWLPFSFKRPKLRKSDWIAFGVITIFMASILWHNYLVTGKAFRPPVKHNQSWERLGFKKGHYTPVDALFFLFGRVFYLMDWFAPAIVAVYLLLLFNTRCLKVSLTPGVDGVKFLFRLVPVFVAFAYFFYYSWGGNQWGPRYLWETMPFLCITAADWIICRWQAGSLRARKFLLALVVMSFVTSGMIFARQAEYVEESSRQRRALYDLADATIKEPAIVFIHGHLGNRLIIAEEDAVRNSPFLDGRILYAHDLGDKNPQLMAYYPDREYYRGTYDQFKKKPLLEKLS